MPGKEMREGAFTPCASVHAAALPDGVTVRMMEARDAEGKGFVHYQSWQESYRGIVDPGYLADMTVEKCVEIARRWPGNTAVAREPRIVGFVCWCPCQDSDVPEGTGEISALYVLRPFQGRGIGTALMDFGMSMLSGCTQAVLWVLAENQQAIQFYQRYGFRADGAERWLTLGAPVRCVRMVKKV